MGCRGCSQDDTHIFVEDQTDGRWRDRRQDGMAGSLVNDLALLFLARATHYDMHKRIVGLLCRGAESENATTTTTSRASQHREAVAVEYLADWLLCLLELLAHGARRLVVARSVDWRIEEVAANHGLSQPAGLLVAEGGPSRRARHPVKWHGFVSCVVQLLEK